MRRPIAEQAEAIIRQAVERSLIVRCVSPDAARAFRRALYRARGAAPEGALLSISLSGSDLTVRKDASPVLAIMTMEG